MPGVFPISITEEEARAYRLGRRRFAPWAYHLSALSAAVAAFAAALSASSLGLGDLGYGLGFSLDPGLPLGLVGLVLGLLTVPWRDSGAKLFAEFHL